MTKTQAVIDAFNASPAASQADIAKSVGCDQSFVSRVIGRLEDNEINEVLAFKLAPPKETPPDKGSDDEYQCEKCSAIFTSPTRPTLCPTCGVEFE